ncbi:hypothetical protein Psed_5770 [Pseudonocardia dioxanivorans CB1190]|uniref:Helix-turn-helix domain-containing protein n=1 Tax=Pseudonocardia dioxanivorans (strain ATCC 55486 / DSM 44775 / JCM 13855 / CB1190) TaxID=675635 RepID=F4D1A9_PSEUX|nr:helix-turn-helix domain-containing protein [Pseudonocardia dioxanivorans]AEA27897.1 hypothetical protein Psed_5770 [Pseudonocardia dioxanivorans CB1190]
MTRTDPWPWPADTQLDRARRVARDYREALAQVAPTLAARLDDITARRGQGWIAARPVAHDPDDLLTVEEVAEFCQVAVRTVTTWRLERTPPLPGKRTADGIRIRFGDLVAWQAARRRRRVDQ